MSFETSSFPMARRERSKWLAKNNQPQKTASSVPLEEPCGVRALSTVQSAQFLPSARALSPTPASCFGGYEHENQY